MEVSRRGGRNGYDSLPPETFMAARPLARGMPMDAPRGTNDYGPEEMARRRAVEGILRETAQRFGFREIATPTLESLDLFTTKSGPGIVKELYAFKDKGGRDVALRPEFTASIVRFYLSELRNLPKPIKVYTVGNVFRYEEPQKGRYREFTQFNAEIIGAPALQGDAEIIALAIDCLRAVGVRDVQVRIGHIGLLRTYLRLAPEDQGKVLHSLDKRDFPALRRELKRLDLQDIEDPLRQFVELKGGIEIFAKAATALPGVRPQGFEYLTSLAARLQEYGVENAECVILPAHRLDCFVIPIGDSAHKRGLEVLRDLRGAGVSTDIDLLARGPSKNLDYANALRARFAVLIGEAEVKKGLVAVKDLDSGKQEEMSLEALIERARGQRPRA